MTTLKRETLEIWKAILADIAKDYVPMPDVNDDDAEFKCLDDRGHKFVISDDNGEDCYCERCGIRDW